MPKATHFDRFRKQALDTMKSFNERVDFPEEIRAGKAGPIIQDISDKLGLEKTAGLSILEIGCGCTDLVTDFVQFCRARAHKLTLLDSQEMLSAIRGVEPGDDLVFYPGRFPDCFDDLSDKFGPFDRIVVYSVLQYALVDGFVWAFVEKAARLLPGGGRLLIGDLPNASMRRRFLASPAGVQHHKKHYGPNSEPVLRFNRLDENEIDDGLVIGLLVRMRMAGFHAFVMPQPAELPMSNRREDLVVVKP